jgi:hypothetical protein
MRSLKRYGFAWVTGDFSSFYRCGRDRNQRLGRCGQQHGRAHRGHKCSPFSRACAQAPALQQAQAEQLRKSFATTMFASFIGLLAGALTAAIGGWWARELADELWDTGRRNPCWRFVPLAASSATMQLLRNGRGLLTGYPHDWVLACRTKHDRTS